MDILNNFTSITIIPVVLIMLYIFRMIMKSNSGSTSVNFGNLFSVSHEAEVDFENKINELKVKISNLEKENEAFKKSNEEIYKKLNYLNIKLELKQEYRSRLYKISKKFSIELEELLETKFKEISHIDNLNIIKSLDEYNIHHLIIKLLHDKIMQIGMDDFEKNGFENIAKDTDGKFSDKIVREYAKNKPNEFIRELLLELDKWYEIRPLTLTNIPLDCNFDDLKFIKNNITERSAIIQVGFFEKLILKTIENISNDIIELYDFMIIKYNNMISN